MADLGGAATASTVGPSPLGAQQKATPVIAYLGAGTPGPSAPFVAAFRQGLSESGPQAKVIALLFGPAIIANSERMMTAVQEAAQAKGVQLHIVKASTESEIDAAFASLIQRQTGGLLVSPNAFLGSPNAERACRALQIVRDLAQQCAPTITP